jgi:NAD(P)-dependent dehydrogenase (short-subunit alcohol dehydrogenase family)
MKNCEKTYELGEKNIVVTGATSGIGLAAVKLLVESGAFVIGVGRSEKRNQKAQESVLSVAPNASVKYVLADLASQIQVRSLAKKINKLLDAEKRPYVDALVNNAGAYLEKKHMTEDGVEKTFAVNHLAPFLLTHALLPLIKKAEQGRVLTVSSYSHYTTPLCLNRIADPSPYIGLLAYKRSKLCNVLFVYELNRRYDDVAGFAVDPGLVNTEIASKGSDGISDWVWRFRRKQGTSAEVPARTILYLCGEDNIPVDQGYYFKDCQPKTPSRNAKRPDLAARLWSLSTDLTGLAWK